MVPKKGIYGNHCVLKTGASRIRYFKCISVDSVAIKKLIQGKWHNYLVLISNCKKEAEDGKKQDNETTRDCEEDG